MTQHSSRTGSYYTHSCSFLLASTTAKQLRQSVGRFITKPTCIPPPPPCRPLPACCVRLMRL